MTQIFIMMVGFSQSGKSTLARKILKKFPDKFVRVNTNLVQDFLNETYWPYHDDLTIFGKSYGLRQTTVKGIQQVIVENLLKNGHSVILDTCNQQKDSRQKVMRLVKSIGKKIKTLIIWVRVDEKELCQTLREADRKIVKNGRKAAWLDLYKKKQKKLFEAPNSKEAEHFIVYDRKNLKEVFDKIKWIAKLKK